MNKQVTNILQLKSTKEKTPDPFGERTAFEIEDRRPLVRAASLHPERDVKTTIEPTVSFKPISFYIAVVLT